MANHRHVFADEVLEVARGGRVMGVPMVAGSSVVVVTLFSSLVLPGRETGSRGEPLPSLGAGAAEFGCFYGVFYEKGSGRHLGVPGHRHRVMQGVADPAHPADGCLRMIAELGSHSGRAAVTAVSQDHGSHGLFDGTAVGHSDGWR
jgi:hypothetical protein